MKKYQKQLNEKIAKTNEDHSYNTFLLWWIKENYPEFYKDKFIDILTVLMNKNLISIGTDAEVKIAYFMNKYRMNERQLPSYKELESKYL